MKVLAVFKGKWMVFVIMILSISMVPGCVENDMALPPLKAQFQLLDVSGNPTTSFTEGEDIIFDY